MKPMKSKRQANVERGKRQEASGRREEEIGMSKEEGDGLWELEGGK